MQTLKNKDYGIGNEKHSQKNSVSILVSLIWSLIWTSVFQFILFHGYQSTLTYIIVLIATQHFFACLYIPNLTGS